MDKKTEDFYNRLREELNTTSTWPSEYLYKFIVPTEAKKIEEVENAFDGDDAFDLGNHLMNFGSELLPGFYGDSFGSGSDFVKGLDDLYIELGAAGSDAWMDAIKK